MDKIRRDSGATKNKQDLKKHLNELVGDNKISYFPKIRKYLAYGKIPKEIAYDVYLEILPLLINEFALTKKIIIIHGKISIPRKYQKSLKNPTSKFVYEKFMSILELKSKILKTELKEIKRTFKDQKIISALSDDAKFKVIQFSQKILDFVNSLDDVSSYISLEKISNYLDQEFIINEKYWKQIKIHNRPFYEVLDILVTKQVLGIKDASAVHLKIIQKSSIKHGPSSTSKGIYPKRMTNTKRFVKKFERPEGIDPFKILDLYESEIGKVLGTNSEDYHNMMNSFKISIACAIVSDRIPKNWSDKQIKSALKIVGGKKGAKQLVNDLSEKLYADIFQS